MEEKMCAYCERMTDEFSFDDEKCNHCHFSDRIKESGNYHDGESFSAVTGQKIDPYGVRDTNLCLEPHPYDQCPRCECEYKRCPHLIITWEINPFWKKRKVTENEKKRNTRNIRKKN